jgi:hypothetical protein|tara:strand:- start:104 stop:316 length:213 start_codon:yes stop_codon:yes gene_type:complete
MAYKKKLNSGATKFHKHGFKVSWKTATQEELQKVYDLGYTQFVTKDAEPKKKTNSKKSSKNVQDKGQQSS